MSIENSRRSRPVVSIGLPVYNGEAFLSEAIECFLAQSFADFELIISDNASQDRTRQICESYAAQDSRVCYVRSEVNVGAARNFNRVVELSSGKYFKWAAHDDICEPAFLEQCVAVMESDEDIVLCYPRARVVDARRSVLLEYTSTMARAGSNLAYERFGSVVRDHPRCSEIFGLIRATSLRQTRLIGPYVASDRTLLAELALRGRFYEIPDYLFLNRDHPLRSVRLFHNDRDRGAWFDPSLEGRVAFTAWRLLVEYGAAVRNSDLRFAGRLRCYRQLLKWVWEARFGFAWEFASGMKHGALRKWRRLSGVAKGGVREPIDGVSERRDVKQAAHGGE